MKMVALNDKDMSNGMRDTSKTPLTKEEIEFVKAEIKRIEADESIFIFNDERHIGEGTCYNFVMDRIFITRNVFPDSRYGSTHPRDLMSVRAVLAHEYYGHRPYRDEYLADIKRCEETGENFTTTPQWKDECRASITAAKLTPNLTQMDRANLVQDAVYRAKEYGHIIEMDDFMKEVVYGYSNADCEKKIAGSIAPIRYISETSVGGMEKRRKRDNGVPEMWN